MIPTGSSLSKTIFEDRVDAGQQLARHLLPYKDENPIVFGLPRGGVVVAYEVSRQLDAPLDIIVARKLGAPMQPELGIGAIAPNGVRIVDERTVHFLGISEEQIERVVEQETGEMERRLRLYRGDRPQPDLSDRTAIVVDDGLATGVTARAAVRSLQSEKPRRVILGVPVCAAESAASFRSEVDEVVCVQTPVDFRAVGFWYRNFDQTTDEEVIHLLERARQEVGQ